MHKRKHKTRHPKLKQYLFIASYNTFPIFKEYEQLSSSTCWRVMSYSRKCPWLPFLGAEFVPNLCFLGLNFDSRYASKPIKPCIKSDDSLLSKKNLSQKMARWFGAQCQVSSAKKSRKRAPL